MTELVNPTQEQKQQYLTNLLKRFEQGDATLSPTARTLLGKYSESRKAAEQTNNQLEQMRRNIESGNQQLQQEVGRGTGYLESILALCPPTQEDMAPLPAQSTPTPDNAPKANRHARRAEAATKEEPK